MAELTVATTYGQALFEAARDLNKTAEILEDSAGLLEVLEAEPDFFSFLNSPCIPAREKKQVLEKALGGKVCEEFLNLMYILVDKGRTRALPGIVKEYKILLSREEGYSYGRIVSVTPLSEAQLARFEEETGKLLKMKVRLENEIDTRLIGGIVIYIEGKIIDASVKTRLHVLAGSLT